MNIILNVVSSLFDLAILFIYLRHFMEERKKNIPMFLYFGAFVLNELLLYCHLFIPEQWHTQLTLLMSFVFTFGLTFLHKGRMRYRFFITFSFQAYASLSEFVVYALFSMMPEYMSDALLNNPVYGSVCSKIVLFIFLNITMLLYKRPGRIPSVKYTLLVLIMPVLSIVLLLTIPIQTNLSPLQAKMSLLGMSGILIANLANFFLLQSVLKLTELQQIESNLRHQLRYQIEKYQQISTSYRDTRRLIHDTKKHFFFLQKCMEQKDYDAVIPYLNDSITDLEQTYIATNTGNLVIDSFISNYSSLAEEEGIQFRTDIRIQQNQILIRDYDLSIILGNLLDNALNACRKIQAPEPRQISVQLFTTSQEFIVHIENTTDALLHSALHGKEPTLDHGYGIKNVENTTLKYYGSYSHKLEDGIYNAIVSIPCHYND